MFVTNWISTTKIQKISEITNFFRHYFLSRTEVRQYTLRFGYVRIKRRNESVINISKETKKFRCILQNNSFTSATELIILIMRISS